MTFSQGIQEEIMLLCAQDTLEGKSNALLGHLFFCSYWKNIPIKDSQTLPAH